MHSFVMLAQRTGDITDEEILQLPLTKGWSQNYDDDEEAAYFTNDDTKEDFWEHPSITLAREQAENMVLPSGWIQQEATIQGGVIEKFYYNHATQAKQWDHPCMRACLAGHFKATACPSQGDEAPKNPKKLPKCGPSNGVAELQSASNLVARKKRRSSIMGLHQLLTNTQTQVNMILIELSYGLINSPHQDTDSRVPPHLAHLHDSIQHKLHAGNN